jgi:hypothetical protein
MDLKFQDRLLLCIASVSLLTCFFYLYYQICKLDEEKRLAEERERMKNLEGMGGLEDIFKLLIYIPILFTRLGYLAEGMIHLIMGAAFEAVAAFETLMYVAEDMVNFWTKVVSQALGYDLPKFFTDYLMPYFNCYSERADKIFTYCLLFYFVDLIMQLLYLPLRATFWGFNTFLGIDFVELLIDPLWSFIQKFDYILNKYAKFHIINDNNFNMPMTDADVMNVCYHCQGTKTLTELGLSEKPYKDWILQVVHHWFHEIPDAQAQPIDELATGGKSFLKVFTG